SSTTSPAGTRRRTGTRWLDGGSVKVADIFETMEYGPAPESAAPAEQWLDRHGREFEHFIGGEWQAPVEGEDFETYNPADGKPIARGAQGSDGDVDRAVRAARAAVPAWRDLGGHARAPYLQVLARLGRRPSATPSRGWSSAIRGSPPFSSRSTTGSRSASRATSTSPSSRGTSTTTPGGRSSWSRSSQATSRSAWPGRSSPGTYRSSCSRG